jgi:SpoVK/Ycf46/Vps4 family AAA+-type ATPase
MSPSFNDEMTHHSDRYVGADLVALTREAAVIAVNRIFHSLAANTAVRFVLTPIPTHQTSPLPSPQPPIGTLISDLHSLATWSHAPPCPLLTGGIGN